MPMKIKLKFPELPSAATATIGGALLRLDAVEEAVKPYDDTDEGEAILSVVEALRSCTLYAQKTESSVRGALNNSRETIETAAEMAASRVPTDGFPGPGQYEAAKDRAVDEVVKGLGADTWRKKLDADQQSASNHAKAATLAMQNAKRTIDLATAKRRGPAALREKTTMDDLAMLAGIKEEEATKRPSEWLPTFESLIAEGDEKAERAYVTATKLLAQEVVAMQHTKLRERLGVMGPDNPERREVVERERSMAIKFVDRVRERAEELIPESLKLATLALQELQGIYCALLGYHALVIARDAFDRHRSMPGASPLDVEPSWPMRLGLATAKGQR